jgi:NAD-dependent deacetylase
VNEPNLIDELRKLLAASKRTVVFTGAGISTESGIPDFRSPGGIWTKYQPIDFRDFISSDEARKETWRRKIAVDGAISRAEPNLGHRAIARLVALGKVPSVITQNIDGLHQRSGIPDEKVIELHGNGTYAACLECARRYELAEVFAAFNVDEEPPMCDCGGFIKSATISFGQSMPVEAMRRRAESSSAKRREADRLDKVDRASIESAIHDFTIADLHPNLSTVTKCPHEPVGAEPIGAAEVPGPVRDIEENPAVHRRVLAKMTSRIARICGVPGVHQW